MAARRKIVLAVSAAGVTAFTMVQGLAGPLDPPVGPIGPTMKTLQEVEPRIPLSATNTPGDADSIYRITAPGSYYLTGNITGAAGKSAIEIAAASVVLDLRGFELVGVPGSLDGITFNPGSYLNVTIRNGSARLWGGDGVDAFSAVNATLCDLHTAYNTGDGIRTGAASVVSACHAYNNGGDGMDLGDQATVGDCTATANGGTGIKTGNGAMLAGCAARQNVLGGIFTGTSSTVSRCGGRDSGSGVGIQVGFSSIVSDCAASGNFLAGIRVELGCTARGCSAENNGVGILAFSAGNVIETCTASQNNGDGISALTGHNTIRHCEAYLNDLDGIKVTAACVVTDNTSNSNGAAGTGAGIHATGSDNRIDGNSVGLNDVGVAVDAAGNLVVRNTASANTTNYSTTGTQTIGPIITATGTIASTNPWANFEY